VYRRPFSLWQSNRADACSFRSRGHIRKRKTLQRIGAIHILLPAEAARSEHADMTAKLFEPALHNLRVAGLVPRLMRHVEFHLPWDLGKISDEAAHAFDGNKFAVQQIVQQMKLPSSVSNDQFFSVDSPSFSIIFQRESRAGRLL
jgi:hypothetical protein